MPRKYQSVLGARIDALAWEDAIDTIATWGAAHESRYICICNVHSVVTTTSDPEFKLAVNSADMCTPDGAPVAWALRQLGFSSQARINGPDLMWRYLAHAQELGQNVFFYGSTQSTLMKLTLSVTRQFTALKIAGTYAPPFRELTRLEDDAVVEMINRSGAHVIFVGLGCPKQEKWMAAHRGRINAVMIGVGAAFDYHSGVIKRAPAWMQNRGLEWLHRLNAEPRRLFRRYMVTNTLFVLGLTIQLLLKKPLDK